MIDNERVNDATNQFTGFLVGAIDQRIHDLVRDMGLTKDEWQKIKDDGLSEIINYHWASDIDDYFAEK